MYKANGLGDDIWKPLSDSLRRIDEDFPVEHKETKQNVIHYLKTNQIPVDYNILHADEKPNLMSKILIRLRSLLPEKCELRDSLTKTIIYTVLREYYDDILRKQLFDTQTDCDHCGHYQHITEVLDRIETKCGRYDCTQKTPVHR